MEGYVKNSYYRMEGKYGYQRRNVCKCAKGEMFEKANSLVGGKQRYKKMNVLKRLL